MKPVPRTASIAVVVECHDASMQDADAIRFGLRAVHRPDMCVVDSQIEQHLALPSSVSVFIESSEVLRQYRSAAVSPEGYAAMDERRAIKVMIDQR
jgi:hypothetical protein